MKLPLINGLIDRFFSSQKKTKFPEELSAFPGHTAEAVADFPHVPSQVEPETANLVIQAQEDSVEKVDVRFKTGGIYLVRYTSNNAVYGWAVRRDNNWSRIFPSYTTALNARDINPNTLAYSSTLSDDSIIQPAFSFQLMEEDPPRT